MGFYNADSATWGFKWGTNQVSYTQFADGTPAAVMPEFYQLQAGKWTPVSAATVPSQLASVTFDSGSPPATPGTYTVPSDPVWTNPGPAAGPFQARIEDGNVVTYYWFRFADQPAIMKAGLTPAERERLQANMVKIHSAWTNGGTYLAPPTMGTLCDVDPALLVTPPPGLEVGYVPVASNEFWGGWVTPTWNQATSGHWSTTSNWVSTSAPEGGGHSYYRLNFAPAGSYTTTNDLSNGYGYGGFAANQLNFSGAVMLTGNPITLTADVGSYPQINQNSANAVMIDTPLNLDVSTTLGGTGSGLVVISNVISGPWHSLTINSPATWRICGLTPNTYSGGTIIKRGTLIWGASTTGTSPDCSSALGSGPVTLHSGATLQFEKASPTNALTLNGGTLYAANSAGATWMGPVTVNSNATVRTDYGMGISGNISGSRGLTKTGVNTLTLSGVNTYAGANVVQAGTLSCATPGSLGAGALSISNGATVNLNYSGTRSLLSLTLGGVNKLAGVYGSSNSPATYQDARFSGPGTVTVPVPLSITALPATGIATHQATLNANLGLNLAYGGANATVLVYWGSVNGGTNPAAWANSAYVGKWTNVLSTNISYTVTGLAMNTNTTYYFTFLATNATYTVWATNVLSFTTPTKLAFTSVPVYPPAGYPFSVTVQAQDANGKPQAVTSATTVQVSKISGSGTLSGTVSGTILNGSSSVVISGATYSAADTMTLTATAVSGMGLGAGVSPPITFMPPDLTWDANGSGAAVRDGGGVWLNTTNTWWNGITNLNWADNYNARFGVGGAGGTITLDTVIANRVTFTNFSGTYTLTGGTLNVMSNLTVANSSGSVVLTYIIGGPGGVTMNSPGSLRIYGLSPNTYSGGTIINRGTLIWGTMVNGISPDCNYALGTGPVTLNSGATLQFEKASPSNALILNGGTFHSANGWGVTWSGPVTLNSNTTLRADYRMEFRGNISGTGGFTKTSGNTVTLSGSNTYTGASVVQAGTLSCAKSASLGSGALRISNGAVVDLNYSGTRRITALTLGGTNMALGVYGSTNSSATKKDSHFSGTGTVTVNTLNEPPSSCVLTSPTNGQHVALPPMLNATAADPDDDLVRVSFHADGDKVGEDTTAPYSFAWSNAVAGVHSLYAVAIDAGGRQLTSAVANVTLACAISNTLVPAGAVWRYFDKTNDLGASWRSNSFNDVSWSNGPARLGFGGDGEVTMLASNKQWTTYFRRTLCIPDPAFVQSVVGRLTRDDGAVLYLNGAEIWRDPNMPDGLITNQTSALTSVSGETNWVALDLAPATLTLLTPGRNLLAAEVHQSALTSSDLGFDLELTGTVLLAQTPELQATLSGSSLLLSAPAEAAYFKLYSATDFTPPVYWIPATNTAVLTNNQWHLTMPVPTNGQCFFRLQTS
jgi:autotransporter-associated beta strand protein